MNSLRCVICKKKDKVKILAFTPATLEKCHVCLIVRREYNLKYSDVILPSEISVTEGYHSACYSNFTSIKQKYKTSIFGESSSSSGIPQTKQQVVEHAEIENVEPPSENIVDYECNEGDKCEEPESLSPDHASLNTPANDADIKCENTNVCIFCSKARKKFKGRQEPLVSLGKQSLMKYIEPYKESLQDTIIYQKILSFSDLKAHRICRCKYYNYLFSLRETPKTDYHKIKKLREEAFNDVCSFIEENVIENGKCYFFTFLCNFYDDCFMELCDEYSLKLDSHVGRCLLEEKLLNKYAGLLQVTLMRRKKIIGPKDRVIDEYLVSLVEEEDIVLNAANILRQKILNMDKKPLPENLRTSDILKGECLIPQILKDFYVTLVAGSQSKHRKATQTDRICDSLADDVIFNVTNGDVKTKKHLTLALTLKSLTNSRKVVDIINRYGHCCSYNVAEKIETECTNYSWQHSASCPEGIVRTKGLHTGVAFDNSNRFVDTSTGKDTVGIIYQNVDSTLGENSAVFDEEISLDIQEAPENPGPGDKRVQKRRRSLEVVTSNIVPYSKKIKTSDALLSNSDLSSPTTLELTQTFDVLWMLSHAIDIPNTPMWVGFNSKFIQDFNTTQQKICYLTPINRSLNLEESVIHTMKESQKMAEELGESSICVTYDIPTAKVAMQIQSTEKPTYDNLFIHFGAFHIMLDYFKAVGKFIDGCGLMNIAVDSGLIASGSVNSFLDAKQFNKCKRLHPLMALGLEIMHFRSFLENSGKKIDEDLRLQLMHFADGELSFSDLMRDNDLSELIESYVTYRKACLNGEFGKTAQYYVMYIQFINYYLILSRSIRTGNFLLYKYVLQKIVNLILTFNQPNYARWLVKYHDNLINIDAVNPELKKKMEEGYFGIQLTDKSFSRQPIDTMLERMINADAAKKLTGIISSTNSIAARQRWCSSHQMLSTIISYTYESTGLRLREDVTPDLSRDSIKTDTEQLKKFINTFSKFLNPFDASLHAQQLLNISNGRAASPEVEQFLLNAETKGNELRERLINDCSGSAEKFERSISRLNFSSEVKGKIKNGRNVQEVSMQRDLFGKMLGISMDLSIDMEKILCYPVTPVPMTLCHFDGTICKTAKSAIVDILERQHQPGIAPNIFDVVLVDGFFLLQTLHEVPETFGDVSKKIMEILTSTKAPRVDIIFDQYVSPSIKDYDRNLRNEKDSIDDFAISSPMQVCPTNFQKSLKNINFKQALVKFFINHWCDPEMVPFIGQTIIHLNYDFCYSYTVDNDSIVKSRNNEFHCGYHEEADTKIVYHACQLENDVANNILIKSCDSDVLIIMLGNMDHRKNENSNIFMEYGATNNRRILNITQLYTELGPDLCKSLPGFHALTGCAYNPSFFRKGKNKSFKLISDNVEYQMALIDIGNTDVPGLDYKTFATLEKFVCELYGCKNCADVNNARFIKFCNTCKCTSTNESLKKNLLKYDASNLPPCKAELHQHLLRTQYITCIWRNAHSRYPTFFNPEESGWYLKDGKYEFKWFEGDCIPQTVFEVIKSSQTAENNDKEDEEHSFFENDDFFADYDSTYEENE